MRFIILYLFCVALFMGETNAQAYPGKTENKKADENALLLDTDVPANITREAIMTKLEKMGYKGKDKKGVVYFEGIIIPAVGSELMDYYFEVESKGKKDRDGSVIYMYIKKGGVNIFNTKIATAKNKKAEDFLNEFPPYLTAYLLDHDIKTQGEEVSKAEKRLSKLEGDLSDLEKKKKKLEKDIEDNLAEQEKQREDILKQNMLLQNLKAKKEQE
jgi:hypothetical protein